MSEQRQPARRRAWWRQPLGMGVLGVVLMVGGWVVMSYVPQDPSSGPLGDLRRWAAEQSGEEGAAGLRDRLPAREPPYRLPGRLILLAGIVLFVAAGARMWQQPEPSGDEERSLEDSGEGDHP